MSSANKLTAVIVDDEIMARENLRMMLEEYCPEINVLDGAENIVEAKEKILKLKPDVIFLDIRMPSGSEGFELLESIENKDFQVVFVTAFKDYAIQALNANAIHYILKPIDIDDLQTAVQKLVDYHELISNNSENEKIYKESVSNLTDQMLRNSEQKRITLYHSKGFHIVDIQDILRLEASGNYTVFHFQNGKKYTDSKTLKFYDEILSQLGFFRIHKSHLINLSYLREYISKDGHSARMSNEDLVPISRNRLSSFLTEVKKL